MRNYLIVVILLLMPLEVFSGESIPRTKAEAIARRWENFEKYHRKKFPQITKENVNFTYGVLNDTFNIKLLSDLKILGYDLKKGSEVRVDWEGDRYLVSRITLSADTQVGDYWAKAKTWVSFHANEKDDVANSNFLDNKVGRDEFVAMGGVLPTKDSPKHYSTVSKITLAKDAVMCGYNIPAGSKVVTWPDMWRALNGYLHMVNFGRKYKLDGVSTENNILYFKRCKPTNEVQRTPTT